MACPLFVPSVPLGEFGVVSAPLGDLFDGVCAGDRGAAIPVEVLRGCCNFGYARGRCARAAMAEADAVRFLVKAERDGWVEVACAVEREHHPVSVGTVMVGVAETAGADTLTMQARACALAYLRQTRG